MSKVFCATDKAVLRVLSTIESMPEYVFAETELTRLSHDGFSSLKETNLIIWKQFDWEHELFVSHLPGDIGTLRYLRKRDDGKYWAYPEYDDSKDRIELDETDLPHWIFDIAKLTSMVKEANSLSGDSEVIADNLRYIGTDSVNRTAVYVGFFDDDNNAAAALAVIPKQNHEAFFVLCPTFNIPQKTISAVKMNIKTMTFAEAFTDDWRLAFGSQRKRKPKTQQEYETDYALTFIDFTGELERYAVAN